MPAKTRSKSPRKPKFETWVTDVVTRLSGELNLQQWRIGLNFDVEDPEALEGTTAWVSIDSRYMSAYISFTENARYLWDEGRMVSLVEAVTHEVTHVLLDPLHKFAIQAATPQTESHLTDILEQTNQRLARVVIDLLPSKFFSR